MIPDFTVDGTPIKDLNFNSKKKVCKTCDRCLTSKEVTWNTVIRCRKRHNTDKDYCYKCSMVIYNTGKNNPAKRKDVRDKISKATKGKSKKFKDGINGRIMKSKITTNGYILKYDELSNTHVLEHKLVVAKEEGKDINKLGPIHHIDGDKLNNKYSNLIETDVSKHTVIHKQLESLAFDLVKRNLIFFDKETCKYVLSPELQLKTLNESIGFESIAIVQKKNICKSRLDADIRSEFVRGVYLDIPFVAANMSTVVDSDFYIKLYELGAVGILHRAQNIESLISEVNVVKNKCDIVAASIGVGEKAIEDAKSLIKNDCNVICIDIAHGYSDETLNIAKVIKKYSPSTKIILGNSVNPDIMLESYEFIDAIKVGIAQGFACETKNTAGCTEKQFSAVLKFKELSKKLGIPIISDGGVREPADFTKAIAAGASTVMAGKVFAECKESAAEIVSFNDEDKKLYAGMASSYVQEQWKGGLKSGTCSEGGVRYLDISGSVEDMLERYSGALRSGITYAGAKDIDSFHDIVEFVKI